MTKDSEEYKQFCAEYEAKEKERKDNPDKYPYFAYYQYGFHRMTYITEEELKEAIEFYHLKSDCKGGYFRYGRQPITVRSDYFNGEFWKDAKKYCYEVIAWMPLPKPYEPQERSSKE